MISYQYNASDYYVSEAEDHGFPPNNSTHDAPPPKPWVREWPRKKSGAGWEMVEDHRERKAPYFPEDVEQEGTPYWIPSEGDDWQSQPRTMKEAGPLPEGASLTPPKQTLDELKSQKRQSFAATFATIEQRAQRPQSTVLAALIDASPVPEPDADFIWQLEDIKATNRELLAQLEACTDWEEAQQIAPWLPPVGGGIAHTKAV